MEYKDGNFIFTEQELSTFNRLNPTLFAIVSWMYKNGVFNRYGMVIQDVNSNFFDATGSNFSAIHFYDEKGSQRCLPSMILGNYAHINFCHYGLCYLLDSIFPSCFELTWRELIGTDKVRKNITANSIEERRKALLKTRRNSIKVI